MVVTCIFAYMKKILRLYRNWRYRRLYRKFFWHYINKTDNSAIAIDEADSAFYFLTNKDAANLGFIVPFTDILFLKLISYLCWGFDVICRKHYWYRKCHSRNIFCM